MPKINTALYAFNRGLVSQLALARIDIDRLALSAETFVNWMSRALGSMMLRPGAAYIGATASNNQAKFIPFIFSTDDVALVEVTTALVRVWVSDALVTRASVTAAITNGTFTSNIASWTDDDESGAVSAWVTGGYLGLTGNGTNFAIQTQQVTVNEANTEHALSINIARGPVIFRCGSTSGGDEYITETALDTGYHSLSFTPTGNFYVQFKSRLKRQVLVDSIAVESSGTMTITAPWSTSDLSNLRWVQSGDIIFIACQDKQQYKIERRSTTSWSVVKYMTDDGPLRALNTSTTTITPSALSGNVTLTASKNLFKNTNVGSLYRITSDGQIVTTDITAGGNWTSTIRVTGISTSRAFTVTISGIWSGTVTLQKSLTADSGPWETHATYTANTTTSVNDALDNQIVWYRIGVDTSDFDTKTIVGATQTDPCEVSTSAAHGFATGETVGISSVSGMTELNNASDTITDISSSSTITNATQANPCQVTTSAAHNLTTGNVVHISDVEGMIELNGNSYTITVVNATNFTLGVDSTLYTAYSANGAATFYGFEMDNTDATGYTAYTSGGTAISEGPVTVTLDYPLGSVDGYARITAYSSEISVSAEVITDFGGTSATDDWAEGAWSDRRGWPTAVTLAEGRLAWAGKDNIWMSVSDSYYSYDELTEGDSGPIDRTIGSGPVDTINWLISLKRLLLGAEGAEWVCRSNGDDEPLTPTNFNMKTISTQGSNAVSAVKIDNSAVYIQRGGYKLYDITYGDSLEYSSNDLSLLYPDIGSPGITHIAVQRQPDTRIHCVRSDGTVAILVYDSTENVNCWINYTTDGTVEDVVILPGSGGEESVYYVVNRTINGSTVRYLEKWALESQCAGGTVSRNLDSHLIVSQASSTTISGLTHLEGETVYVWGGGKDLGSYTVSSGSITVSEAVTNACVGLTYTAQYKSSKLAYAAGMGTALVQKKKITRLGLILKDTHYQAVQYGRDFSNLNNMPLMKDGTTIAADTVHSTFDEESFFFDGVWDTDSRLCLQVAAPKPATILAAIISIETHDKY
jgi:hypothetical protein